MMPYSTLEKKERYIACVIAWSQHPTPYRIALLLHGSEVVQRDGDKSGAASQTLRRSEAGSAMSLK